MDDGDGAALARTREKAGGDSLYVSLGVMGSSLISTRHPECRNFTFCLSRSEPLTLA